MKTRAWATALFVLAGLCACTSSTNAVLQSAQYALRRDAPTQAQAASLNPNFRYLRATIKGRVALLVLGYVEPQADGPIQVWYSAEREVLRLKNGRIVGATGLTTEWRNVKLEGAPSWPSLQKSTQTPHWSRVRDVMPGYRLGVRDTLALQAIPVPKRTALQEIDPERLAWYEERLEEDRNGSKIADEDRLPPARYAVAVEEGAETVIYSEQCLAPKLCFTLQHWPAVLQSARSQR